MREHPRFIANTLLFAVIIALLLQPLTGIDSNNPPLELSDEVKVSHSVQNEWTQSAGMASGGLGTIIWPNAMTTDSYGDVLVAGMLLGDAQFGTHTSSSNLQTGSPFQLAYVAKADSSTGNWDWLSETGEYGGGGFAMINGIDTHGTDIYVCGWFSGNVTFGNSQYRSTQDTMDIFVSKLNSNGQFQWTAVAGGSTEDDACEDITVDANGNVFATGTFNGTANFNANSQTTSGKIDIWIAEMLTGQVTIGGNRWDWVYTAGGPEEDIGVCITTDGTHVYGCGWFTGTATFGSQQTQGVGQLSSYVVKLTGGSNAGSHVDVASVGATGGIVQIMDMIADSGTVYTTGHLVGAANFGTHQIDSGNDRIIFVAELSSNNLWSWATPSDSGAYQTSRSIDLTSQGGIVIAGSFASVTSDGNLAQSSSATFGSTTLSSTYTGMVIAGMDSSGSWLWAEAADGALIDEGHAISITPTGSIVSLGAHCAGGATSGQSCSVSLGTGSEATMGNAFSDPSLYGYAFNTGIHLWAIQADSDGDGIGNGDDNCPSIPNADQSNIDNDNFGDVCDSDMDGDNKDNGNDNCNGPEVLWDSTDVNLDMDQDGCMDATEDTDDDGDGVGDVDDTCTGLSFKQQWSSNSANDHDGDGCHDLEEDSDDDNDGIEDGDDDCQRGWHNWTSNVLSDYDDDGCADDGEDSDDDNDAVNDAEDNCPTGEMGWISDSSTDLDGDGCIDTSEDTDDDNDGVPDNNDQCSPGPNGWKLGWTSIPETDHDGDGCLDYFEDSDDDNDGVADDYPDSCKLGMVDWVSDLTTDPDGDGCHNDEDSDDDGDGFQDLVDSCPQGETGWFSTPELDADRDGCLDSSEDLDDDDDTVSDLFDQCPNTPAGEMVDPDGCGYLTQQDTDGDGVWNQNDNICSTTPSVAIREMFVDEYEFNVSALGCWDGELDPDYDQYRAFQDECPNTPAQGVSESDVVEMNGCRMSEYDDDADGVQGDRSHPLGKDQCLETTDLSTRMNHSSFEFQNNGCWDGDKDDDGDGILLYQDICPNTPDGEPVLSEGPLKGCSESERDEDGDGVMTADDKCLDTPDDESVEKSGKYTGCSFDERLEMGDTSAVIEKNMVWIILGSVATLLLAVALTMTFLRRNRGNAEESQWVGQMPDQFGGQVEIQTSPVAQAPMAVSDYTQLPGGGQYVTGSMGETIYNAPDMSAWQMNADGSFTRIQ
ncbi:MAG: thrombospondin type 3 repeat-containing protein [Candidatus Thermoplasmatota archaeon]|nr:thrombospondin type 3 repeat-containing protein [Candidatus Thermoplasmatota archaeon]MEE3083210.1 thrombospondin type 3 repeat-containing protein [Candidatus Thermoplasmatota archaeon]